MSVVQYALIFALILLLALGWWWSATATRRRNIASNQKAQRGERRAERLLERAGYTVLDRQVTRSWLLMVDGQLTPVTSRADLLVTSARSGRCYVAEVKTGVRGPDPTHPATRRQLMEYLHVFPVDGVILVDAEAGRLRRVAFPTE